jgi:hypothetical protein
MPSEPFSSQNRGGHRPHRNVGACARGTTPEPKIETVEVKVPVPVPCKANVDVHESYSDAAAEAATDIFEKVRLLLVGREERMADVERLKGAVTGCGGTVQ